MGFSNEIPVFSGGSFAKRIESEGCCALRGVETIKSFSEGASVFEHALKTQITTKIIAKRFVQK